MSDLARYAAALPDVQTLESWLRASAVISVCQHAPSRWGPTETFEVRPNGWKVFSANNGAGDDWSATFTPEGAVLRLFSHESSVSPYANRPVALHPGLLEGLPAELHAPVFDPAFDAGSDGTYEGVPSATVLLWRLSNAPAWEYGSPLYPENANEGWWFLEGISGPVGMLERLEEYSDSVPSLSAVEHVYRGEPLTQEIVSAFNPGRLLADVVVETSAMGHPL